MPCISEVGIMIRSFLLGALVAWTFVVPASSYGQRVDQAQGHQGIAIEYEVVSQGSPTLLFVHGWMCDRTYWREQVDQFAAKYGVVLLDLGGHGQSSSDRSDWTISSFARDVSGVLRALDLQDVVLVGHSMGGPVIAEVALLEPSRVRGVVGVDTYQYVEAGWLAGNGVPNLVARLQRNFAGTTRGFVRSMFIATSDSALASSVATKMVAGNSAVGISATQSMFEWYRDSAVTVLNRVRQPMWTINSREYVGIDVERLHQQVPGLRVTIMDGVGHFLMLEAPSVFNRHLELAVARILAGGD
jgi:pimeloyl-ACP methyl ester carboxylesterase